MQITKTIKVLLAAIGSLSILAGLAAKPKGPAGGGKPGKDTPSRPIGVGDAASGPAATRPHTGPATGPDSVVLPKEMDVPTVPVPPSPPLAPAEALKTFKVAPGFRIELVAAEPLVEDPVAIHFDGDGRLWVCEMVSYMPHLDPGADEKQPIGRVSYLEDTDGDGKFDKKTVFLDDLVLPRACTPYRDGVLVAAPPFAWFCRDTNGDGKCDERQLLATDFDNHANPEHQPNGLMPGLDNLIHNSQWPARFRYAGDARAEAGKIDTRPAPNATTMDPRWLRAAEPGRGQWGITQDDVGRVYTNGNSDLLRADALPAYLLTRNPNYIPAAGSNGLNQKAYDDQSTYPVRPTPGTNRAYQTGALDKEGRLRSVTAACGPHIYRGDLLGADSQGRPVEGNAFICEPSANLVKREILTDDGLTVKGKQAYDKAEFLASTDERFRPVFLADGPDGALYVCDLYRGILQHQAYITPYLRKQILMRDLEQPRHLGRVYRIVPAAPATRTAQPAKPHMLKAPAAELVPLLSHPAGWWRDMAQQQIVARNDPSVAPALQQLVKSGPTWQGRLHGLYALEGLRKLNAATLTAALADADPRVRVAALRLAEPVIAADNASPVVEEVLKRAKDDRPEVRLAFLFTASTINTPAAQKLVAGAYVADAERPYVRDAVLTGLRGRELEFLQLLSADADWAKEAPGKGNLLGGLAGCVFREGKPERVEKMLELIAEQSGPTAWRQSAILAALATPDKKGADPRPVKLAAEPAVLAKLGESSDAKVRDNVKAVAARLTWPGKPGEKVIQVTPLKPEEQSSFDRGQAIFAGTCAACHQPDGLGAAGKAPSMHGSPFLLGPEGVPVRVVLHGLRGQVTIDGETADMEMPTLVALNDEQIADALTYVRREWGHAASPIKPETVAKLRGELKDRGQPWTREELQAMVPGTGGRPSREKGSAGKAAGKAGAGARDEVAN